MSEHRARARLEVAMKVLWSPIEGREKDMSLIKDMSEGGLQIEVEQKLEPGSPLALEILLPGEEKAIKAEAVVAWVRKAREDWRTDYDVGLKLVQITDVDRKALFQFIKLRMTGGN